MDARKGRDQGRRVAHPLGGNHLPIVPPAFAQHQHAQTREIARGQAHHVLGMHRAWARDLALLGRVVVLHADRASQILLERLVDGLSGQLLEGRAGGVEVPVVVLHARARKLRSALWRDRIQVVVPGLQVDARSRGEQVFQGRVLLDRQERLGLLKAQLRDRLAEVDQATRGVVAVQHRQHALANRGDLAGVGEIPVLED
jgi:hypothetical protein